MGIRDEVVNESVEILTQSMTPPYSTTDIRLVSNDVGYAMVEDGRYSEAQFERLSQDRTVELIKRRLKKF